ncbi:MAG: EthD family reductase [Aggregatilineales bacterium]
MVKLALLFRPPPDETAFEEGYNNALALLEQMPNIRRRQACIVVGSPAGTAPYYRILEFYFDNRAAMDEAMLSESGKAAGRALVGFAGHSVELIFADVFEE